MKGKKHECQYAVDSEVDQEAKRNEIIRNETDWFSNPIETKIYEYDIGRGG